MFSPYGVLSRMLRRGNLPGVQTVDRIRLVLQKERALADRTGLQFSVVVYRFTGRNVAASRNVHRLARAMCKRSRTTDEIGWFDQHSLCAVLRVTSGEGGIRFASDVCQMLNGKMPRPLYTVYTYPDPVPQAQVAHEAASEDKALAASAMLAAHAAATTESADGDVMEAD
jgi:hypothetical protein